MIALASCSELTTFVSPEAVRTVNVTLDPSLFLSRQLHMAVTPFLGRQILESIAKDGDALHLVMVGKEPVDVSEPGVHFWHGIWYADTVLAAKFTDDARSNKRVRAVSVFVEDGEPWVVDRKGGDKFQVAVDTTPVTRQGAAAQLCDPVFGHPCHECTSHPYAEAVLTCVDHCDTGACVVVVFGGWDDAEALIGMTRPDRDLPDAKG